MFRSIFLSMSFKEQFYLNFIKDERWRYLTDGLLVTLKITVVACLIGIVLGIVVAAIRSTHDKMLADIKRHPTVAGWALRVVNFFCKIYLTVIRGTPMVVQLMISYYAIFVTMTKGEYVAMIAFGINSGAYVAEIFRSGIMAIDAGQFEAGRSLGFNYLQTMRFIIIPQVIKVVLPTLMNEFIVLVKETSVAGYVAVRDLTKGGDIIRSQTYTAFLPLLAVAAIYLVIVVCLEKVEQRVERRLRRNER